VRRLELTAPSQTAKILPDLSGAAYLARLTRAGSLDASFQPGTIDRME
jgi:hypothetical protein